MKYRLNANLGLEDARRCKLLGSHLSLDPKDLAEGETVDLNEASVDYLTNPKQRGLVALLEPAGRAAKSAIEAATESEEAETENIADESPVSADNAHEAIDQISRMRSPDKLQAIIDTDTRPTVKKAAKDRLDALPK
jgi:hypothetical protein